MYFLAECYLEQGRKTHKGDMCILTNQMKRSNKSNIKLTSNTSNIKLKILLFTLLWEWCPETETSAIISNNIICNLFQTNKLRLEHSLSLTSASHIINLADLISSAFGTYKAMIIEFTLKKLNVLDF